MLRGIWIASWDDGDKETVFSREQLDEIIRCAREYNFNAIFPEVRKVGDAYYLRGFEPRANNIDGPDDWDPLQYMIDQCHDTSDGKRRIEVHAWCVTFRIWRDSVADEYLPGHLLDMHPETAMFNASGEDNADGTQFADPGHPMTQDWTARVFRDLAANYDIDGIHHDYVRYPEYEGDWGHNPVSIARFRERTGHEGKPEADDPRWQAWRRQQVVDNVRRIYAEVHEVNPDCVVSASTLNWALEMDPWKWLDSSPRTNAHQDWVEFMKEGIIDMNCLMSYARMESQPNRYRDWNELVMRTRNDRHGVIGAGVYLNPTETGIDMVRQAMEMGADGVMLYSWGNVNSDDVSREEFFRRLRDEVWTEPVPPPARPWLENPNTGQLIGQVTNSDGEWVDGALVTLDGVETLLTDATGFYAFQRLKPGAHVVEVNGDRHAVAVEAGGTARVGFETE
jgi:uncharacterized lipoprotein YddW (UPF0748 family)